MPLCVFLCVSMRHMYIARSRYFLYRHQDYMFPGIRMLFVYSDDDLVAVRTANEPLSVSLYVVFPGIEAFAPLSSQLTEDTVWHGV